MYVLFYVWNGKIDYIQSDTPISICNKTLPKGFVSFDNGETVSVGFHAQDCFAQEKESLAVSETEQKNLVKEPQKDSISKILSTLKVLTENFGVVIRNGKVMAGSRDLARVLKRNHFDLLKLIRNCQCSSEFRERNFTFAQYTDLNNHPRTEYYMTKDGFTLLVMGFTGKVAMEFKEAYINAFNEMEYALRENIES